jgi:nucleoside-diphosphate-sugar epimerase
VPQPADRLEIVRGSIADRSVVTQAMAGVTHVFHMATVKEDPVQAMDVSVKGMFWLLEEFRQSRTTNQFVLIGGDCVVGHCFVRYEGPITESSPRRPYPGVYALSKALEETMLESCIEQYDINATTLRAPWIMEKDDFRFVLSFGEDQFGGPPWETLISDAERRMFLQNRNVPVLIDTEAAPLKRNFVHVSDLVEAMVAVIDNPAARGQLFNIAMTDPVDYGAVARHLEATRGMIGVPIPGPFHSNILDNAKARLVLAWQPKYRLAELIDEAFAFERAPGDPRKVWYPG